MLKFKKDKLINGLWTTENGVYVIEKDTEFNKYYLYVNGTQYAEAKILKTVKKYAEEHYNK
jgi:hypothetical protein